MNSSIARIFFVVLVLASCAGCKSTYRHELVMPGVPTAVLIHKSPIMSGYIIDRIDGRPGPRGNVSRFEIPAGPRSIVVVLNEGLYRAEKIRIDFEAKANHTYHLNADVKTFGGTWMAWINEEGTGKRFIGTVIRPGK